MLFAKSVAYWIVAGGLILALVTAMAPLPTGSYKLSVGFLLLGLIPYVVYGSLTEIVKGWALVTAGTPLLVMDLFARFGLHVTSAAHDNMIPAIYLCLLLTVLILPGGAAIGRLLSRIFS